MGGSCGGLDMLAVAREKGHTEHGPRIGDENAEGEGGEEEREDSEGAGEFLEDRAFWEEPNNPKSEEEEAEVGHLLGLVEGGVGRGEGVDEEGDEGGADDKEVHDIGRGGEEELGAECPESQSHFDGEEDDD